MTYYFSILNLYITCTNGGRKAVISDSVEFHTASFTFDSSWTGYSKTATFTNSKTGISTNMVLGESLTECIIPFEPLVATESGGNLIVCVQGVKGTSKIYTKMNMSYPLVIELSDESDGTNPSDPTPSVYDQIMALIESGGGYVLPTASTTVKGGIKVDGVKTTIVDDVLNVNLTTDNVEPTSERRYVPIIPTESPSEKFLNGDGDFVSVDVGVSGYVGNLYLSSVDSEIVPTYDTLNYIPDIAEVESEVTITSDMGEVLVKSYLGLSQLDTDLIQSGTWSSRFFAKLSSTVGTTTARGEFFVRHTDETETVLFSKISDDLNDKDYVVIETEETRPSYTVVETDILGFRLYVQTSRNNDTTVTFIVGGVRGAYFNLPLQMRHKQLRDKNEEMEYHHVQSITTNEPSSATDIGVKGDVRITDGYIYVCVETNSWKRVQISTW